MKLILNLLRKTPFTKNVISSKGLKNEECQKLFELKDNIESILSKDSYIAKSEYINKILGEEKIIEYFNVLKKSDMLKTFCDNNNINQTYIEETLYKYKNIENLIGSHNEKFINKKLIEEKEYLDNILKEVDPKIQLDEDQRRVVLTDEDYCLVIAGAGAGKTTTVAAKVKYLVEKKQIDPSQILVISFTNKAVQELKDKLNKDLSIDCPIATFHSTGNAIIRKQNIEPLNIVESSKMYFVLIDYFKKSILKNESLVNNLILFFASYFDAPYQGADLNDFFNKIAKSNYNTLKSDLDEFKKQVIDKKSKKSVTILNEVLKSHQEVEIANFLYMNNIDYEYEPIYKYNILLSRKPYTPDFIIKQDNKIAYIEHFGITQDGKNNRFSDDELSSYKKAINDKIKLHRKHETKLIYTFSEYLDKRPLIEHLKEELENNGFEIKPKSNKEIMEKLVSSEENRYIRKLVTLVCNFIRNFKTNGYTIDEFKRMYHKTQNVRTRLFLDICEDCYLEYERYLKENNAVDFEDMINESAKILREVKEMKQKLDFKYIIVDEYQDISHQRFDLVTALSEVTDAKFIAVGDDWQSIYAFSGSDISLFTNFKEKMGYAECLKIVKTYRNSQEVIDIAGNFIQKNKTQISKDLKSPKKIIDPVIIYTYDGSPKKQNSSIKTGADYARAHAVETVLEQIMKYNKEEGKPENSSILLLGRFGFDGDRLEKTGLFEFYRHGSRVKSVKYPNLNITFMTAHASKGLGYDNVIVLNGRNETYGFPSKIEDDPVLSLVIKQDRSYDYAEERRLFYVAMTRTKNRIFFIAPEQNPSEFLLEIKKDYKNVVLRGDWNENSHHKNFVKKICPICGYPLQYRYKNSYGLRLFMCTNDSELCGFMTNEYQAGKLSILKCDKCKDGYLIIKRGNNSEYFLGCTNYKTDGTGCENSMSALEYFKMLNINENKPIEEIYKECINNTFGNQYQKQDEKIKKKETEEKIKIKDKEYEFTILKAISCTIIRCLHNMSKNKNYGITTLADVLHGSKSQKIINNELNEISEYGKLSEMQKKEIISIIEWLISEEFLVKIEISIFPVLKVTDKGEKLASLFTNIPKKEKTIIEKMSIKEVPHEERIIIEKASIKEVLYKEKDLNDIIHTILQTLNNQSKKRYYGITTLIDILRGASNKKITKAELNEIPEYGTLSDLNREELEIIINWLIDKHFMLKTKHPYYPVLHPTYEGMHYSETITSRKLKSLLNELESKNK